MRADASVDFLLDSVEREYHRRAFLLFPLPLHVEQPRGREHQALRAVHYLRMRAACRPCNSMRRMRRVVSKRMPNSNARMQIARENVTRLPGCFGDYRLHTFMSIFTSAVLSDISLIRNRRTGCKRVS